MTSFLPQSIQNLIEEFGKLPGIGPKSAQRLTLHLLHSPESRIQSLAQAVSSLKKNLRFCRDCWNISENDLCSICSNPSRSKEQICVVEEILDVVALEKTLEYKGVYHVLHGALSPVDGIGPDQLKVQELFERVQKKPTSSGKTDSQLPGVDSERTAAGLERAHFEIILATNPGLEGETTALYLHRLLKPLGVTITRIARGLPVGGNLDYADEMTLTKALQGRTSY